MTCEYIFFLPCITNMISETVDVAHYQVNKSSQIPVSYVGLDSGFLREVEANCYWYKV